ncbi:hypothetical protein R69658_07906 [Paraburkholderia aspalathi]|uniref:Uncharacterized protein n=1 Tax=Paraburkholderia aspalathi TaxID=1324617 RepID=A0ABM8T819_9BURK|nr:hypothetical protein R69658_07906 [Paraburkholderia aspalathi]
MATASKEIIIGIDMGDTEHLAPKIGEAQTDRRQRRYWRIGICTGTHVFGAECRIVRSGQRVAIEFAVDGERQRVEHDIGRRHQMRRQIRCGMRARSLTQRDRVAACDQVGDQLHAPLRMLTCDHFSRSDIRMAQQRRAHFAGFDTKTAQLHLCIVAAEIGELAIRQPSRDIAGAIQTRAGKTERIGNETLGGQCWTICIATRETGAPDIQFALRVWRNRIQIGIEQMQLQIVECAADRAQKRLCRAVNIVVAQHAMGDMHGRFGNPVHVDERRHMRAARAMPCG